MRNPNCLTVALMFGLVLVGREAGAVDAQLVSVEKNAVPVSGSVNGAETNRETTVVIVGGADAQISTGSP